MSDTLGTYQPMRYSSQAEDQAWERMRSAVLQQLEDAAPRQRVKQRLETAAIAFRAGYRQGLAAHAWSVALGEEQGDGTATA